MGEFKKYKWPIIGVSALGIVLASSASGVASSAVEYLAQQISIIQENLTGDDSVASPSPESSVPTEEMPMPAGDGWTKEKVADDLPAYYLNKDGSAALTDELVEKIDTPEVKYAKSLHEPNISKGPGSLSVAWDYNIVVGPGLWVAGERTKGFIEIYGTHTPGGPPAIGNLKGKFPTNSMGQVVEILDVKPCIPYFVHMLLRSDDGRVIEAPEVQVISNPLQGSCTNQ